MFTGRAILFYSGGKDSMLLLHRLRAYLERCIVVWVNTGDPLPEVVEHMKRVRRSVPEFREVVSDQPRDVAQNGYPVDLLPALSTAFGHAITRLDGPVLRAWPDCCNANIWFPTQMLLNELRGEYTTIIRGQKRADRLRTDLKTGDVLDGYAILHPLEDLTDPDVYAELASAGITVPEHYALFKSSIDCWSCTAHLSDNIGKLTYLRERHPEKGAELARRIALIESAVASETAHIRNFRSVA